MAVIGDDVINNFEFQFFNLIILIIFNNILLYSMLYVFVGIELFMYFIRVLRLCI